MLPAGPGPMVALAGPQAAPLLEAIAAGVVVQDPAGRIVNFNGAALELLGLSTDEIRGRTSVDPRWHAVREDGTPFPGPDHPSMRALATGQPVRDVMMGVFHAPSGTYRWLLVNAQPLFTVGDTRPAAALTTFVDVTDRRLADDAMARQAAELQEAAEQRRLALDAGELGAWDYRFDTGAVFWDERCRDQWGIARGNRIRYEDAIAGIHPDERDLVDEAVQRALAGVDDGAYHTEFRVTWPDGSTHWIQSHGRAFLAPGRDGVRRAVRFIGVNREVTREKQAQQSLKELNDTLERRVAQRTAEVVAQADRLRALARELVRTEQRERARLARLLHDHLQQLLVAAKMQAGALAQRAETPAAAEAARRVVDVLGEAIGESRSLTAELSPMVLQDRGLLPALEWLARWKQDKHGLRVDLDLAPDAEPGDALARQALFESVRELLLNVVKHAGVLQARIAARRTADGATVIEVSDAGQGFASGEGGGTEGFGLLGVRQRLENLGGGVSVRSAPGAGTRVELRVPDGTPPVPAEATIAAGLEAAPGAADPGNGEIRVVLADDHKILREGIATILRLEPDVHVVGEASDGFQAIDLATRLRPDVVVMDVSMPGLDGVEATRRITAQVPGVRVIGLSLHDSEDMARAMRQAGASAYLSKGGPADALVASLRDVTRG